MAPLAERTFTRTGNDSGRTSSIVYAEMFEFTHTGCFLSMNSLLCLSSCQSSSVGFEFVHITLDFSDSLSYSKNSKNSKNSSNLFFFLFALILCLMHGSVNVSVSPTCAH